MQQYQLDERLNRIEDKISEKSFRENKGLGNEVGLIAAVQFGKVFLCESAVAYLVENVDKRIVLLSIDML